MAKDSHCWESTSPLQIQRLLAGLTIPWWIAGGWAIDLFVGRQTRSHGDMDVEILRRDQLIMQRYLAQWDLYKTNQPGLKPWPEGECLGRGVNQFWCRRTPQSPWAVDVKFMEAEEDQWVFRRAPAVGGPLTTLGRTTADGIPYLAPEIQLLFKAKERPLPKDEQDFSVALPLLDRAQKEWLAWALKHRFPTGHLWIRRLGDRN